MLVLFSSAHHFVEDCKLCPFSNFSNLREWASHYGIRLEEASFLASFLLSGLVFAAVVHANVTERHERNHIEIKHSIAKVILCHCCWDVYEKLLQSSR